jgi:hypothetical protein
VLKSKKIPNAITGDVGTVPMKEVPSQSHDFGKPTRIALDEIRYAVPLPTLMVPSGAIIGLICHLSAKKLQASPETTY